ncbi:MAG: phosphatidylglycerophosphatase A [bacterium]|nr:phosphatidylglycerophosphatase A [bacterium]
MPKSKKGFPYKLALFFATCGFTGYFPIAPGTVGTAVAVVFYVLLGWAFGAGNSLIPVLTTLVISTGIGIWSAGVVERVDEKKDPGKINIDEFAGFFVAVIMLPHNRVWAVIAFFIFRFFDIAKIWPMRRLEKIKGGVGIMLDDLMAGVYTLIVCHLIHFAACNLDWRFLSFLR